MGRQEVRYSHFIRKQLKALATPGCGSRRTPGCKRVMRGRLGGLAGPTGVGPSKPQGRLWLREGVRVQSRRVKRLAVRFRKGQVRGRLDCTRLSRGTRAEEMA